MLPKAADRGEFLQWRRKLQDEGPVETAITEGVSEGGFGSAGKNVSLAESRWPSVSLNGYSPICTSNETQVMH